MTEATIRAIDGRIEAPFRRLPEGERFMDLKHGVFEKYLDRPEGVTDVQVAEPVTGLLNGLERNLDSLTAKIRRAETDEGFQDLTAEARARKVAEAIREPVEKIQRLSSERLEKAEQGVEAAEARLLASVSRPQPAEPTTEALIGELRLDNRLREIRAGLAGMSESSRLAAVSKAALERDDLEPLWAISEAPTPMAAPKALEDVRRRVVIAREPWRFELVELHQSIHRTTLELAAQARSYISAQLGNLEDRFGLKARLAKVGSSGFEVVSPRPQRRTAA